jgi:hypothetical protein
MALDSPILVLPLGATLVPFTNVWLVTVSR